MINWIKGLFGIQPSETDIKGIIYTDDAGNDKTAYYFETFKGWVSVDEPIVFHDIDTDKQTETSLNEWLIKVREGLSLQWWELQVLEDNWMSMLEMYWGNADK